YRSGGRTRKTPLDYGPKKPQLRPNVNNCGTAGAVRPFIPSSGPLSQRRAQRAQGKPTMTIKKILVPLFGRRPPDTLPLAIALAERFDAFVEVFHPRRDPRNDLAYLAPGAGGFGVGTGVATVLDAAEEDSRARENAARQVYAAAIEGASGRVRTGFVTAMGRETELLPARARVADLALLPRPSD